MLKIKLTILFFLVLSGKMFSQDFSFSQFYETPLLRNPALAGVFNGDVRVIGIHRSQWAAITVPFQTSAASAEVKFPLPKWDDWITIGMQMSHDVAGDIKLKRTQLLPVINYHKSLNPGNDNYISLAFMAGPVNSQFDPTQLKLNDQFLNGSFNPNNPTQQIFQRTGFSYWDASVGITYNGGFGDNARYYYGAALFHFNKPKVGFYTNNTTTVLNNKWVFNAGLTAPTSDNNTIILFGDYYKQGGNSQFFGGLLYGTELSRNYQNDLTTTFYAGGFYRWNDAFVPVVKLDIHRFNIGLSYDVNVSKLKSASQWRGGFELTMSYTAELSNRSYFGSKVSCPKF